MIVRPSRQVCAARGAMLRAASNLPWHAGCKNGGTLYRDHVFEPDLSIQFLILKSRIMVPRPYPFFCNPRVCMAARVRFASAGMIL